MIQFLSFYQAWRRNIVPLDGRVYVTIRWQCLSHRSQYQLTNIRMCFEIIDLFQPKAGTVSCHLSIYLGGWDAASGLN